MFAGAGCTDFATPAELDRAQIIVMVAEPPAVAEGESSQLSIVVADGQGEVTDAQIDWQVSSQVEGLPPLGTVDVTGDAVTYHAPGAVTDVPSLAMVQATVDADGTELVGLKGVVIGPLQFANPTITEFRADGVDVMDTGMVVVDAGATVDLSVTVDPQPDDMTTYAWYSTLGEIDEYRSSPTQLVAPSDPGDGWLFVVVRNGTGGATWRKLRLQVR